VQRYTPEYYKEVQKETSAFLANGENFKGYAIDVVTEGGFNQPPVLIICRAMTDGAMSFEDQELLTRYCIKGKLISILYNDKEVGKFVMNNLNDSFDIFPVFTDHPMSLSTLIEVCVAFVTKKYLPPSQDIPVPEEVKVPLKT